METQTMNRKSIALLTLGAVLLVAITAGASVYMTKQHLTEDKAAAVEVKQPTAKRRSASNSIKWDNPAPARQQVQRTTTVQTASACNDDNIAGKAVGGVGGGVLGSLVGKGKGKTAATIGGTLAGAYVGGEAIPLHNATCR
jgi:uncharacterized protein YcfJ